MSVAAPAPTTAPRRSAVAAIVRESLILTGRSLRTIPRVPERLIDVTIQPIIFIVLFTYVFGSAIHVPGTDYKDFLFPGILVQTVAFSLIGTAVATSNDLHEGVVDRFRSMPIRRISVLIGQALGQMAETVLGVVITVVAGLVVGWSPDMGVGDVLVSLALLLGFLLAGTGLGVLLGLTFSTVDAAQGVGFLVVMPLTFMSGVFVPTDGMPRILEVIGEWNPISPLVAAFREHTGSVAAHGAWPLEHAELASAIWIVLLIAVAVPLGLRTFARATTR
ncbi:ABC transporter permease [Patulibacter sp. S7RM1-6]